MRGSALMGAETGQQTRFGYSAESLPFVETIHPTLRKQITEGKDVNLAALLIPYYTGPHADPSTTTKEKPDPRLNHMTEGFRNGFDTGLKILPQVSFECDNLLSAKKDPAATSELLQTELERGYILGPFASVPFETYRISSLGIAIGKYSGKKRLIVDLSAPHENQERQSLNELIDKEEFSLSYVT